MSNYNSTLQSNNADLQTILETLQTKAAGGGGSTSPSNPVTPVSAKAVNFYDYDGTLLYAYSVEEAQALTELPTLPEREGLICQGWNYNLSTIKSYNREVNIGAMYTTDDGTTRIYIHLEEGRVSPMLGVCPKGTVTVDWGDGTAPDTLTGTSVSTVKWTPTHNYAAPGDYIIRLTVSGTMGFLGASNSDQAAYILRHASGADNRNYVYRNAVQKLEIGNSVTSIGNSAFYNCYSLSSITIPSSVTSIVSNAFHECYSLSSITIPSGVTSIGTYAFYYCYSLSSITIPSSVTSIGIYAFRECYSLSSITIPSGVTSIGTYVFYGCHSLSSITIPSRVTSIGNSAFYGCYSLSSITIPSSVTSIGNNAFYYCYSLSSISIPSGVKSIGNSAFYNCYSLSSITIPSSVTSIGNSAFYNCYGVLYYDFTNHTAVPTLSSTKAFNNIAADCEIRVPAALYDEWIAATNWSTYASYIKAV